ncbi:hypothetical protein EMIHUDRAFT_316078 [Emiliania huxleyi CCMP1516]|uniref:Mediator of RNA polymerase II transcription subunit 9 n=2 Tax=Emiliania huxleyi TaxID=2903 RepID=A0A0D3J8M6_EMIH1|nr:hypothetical protein EMIHUDRAFT_316078 [Emiliania huxleyi CCMP1516]EOD19861.1 hypothetical protein EMIHUDRAFT_316078 [Emiliania huxleyi CCMP1516]|eukprot:XP_005772290.1 hypothetical protein EMIHUDRAFT_316078 [Emiliania huxleyi CCMP1516]
MAQQQIQRVQPVNKPLEHSPKPEKEMLETAVRKPENEMLETAVRNALRELPAPLSAHDIEAAVGRAVREADTGFAQKLDALQRSLERTEAALGALTLSVQARQKADLEQQKALLVQIETLTAAAFGERLPPRRASDVSDATTIARSSAVDVSTVVDITKDNMNNDSEDSAAQLEAAELARRGDSFYFDALL